MIFWLYTIGLLPSLIWLLFYLRKDKNPEPKSLVVRIFLLGGLAAVSAIFLQKGFQIIFGIFSSAPVRESIIVIFLGGAFIEELVKYLAVRFKHLKSSDMDEPTDIMIYMIISALGFAALENILILTNYHPLISAPMVFKIMFWRFISATFLHALCSGLLGYFIALSFHHLKRKEFYFFAGLFIASCLHGFYNWFIIKGSIKEQIFLPFAIIASLAIFISCGFKKLKRSKSVCKVI